MKLPQWANFCGYPHVVPYMREIYDAHVAPPRLAVVEVAAPDDRTAFAIQELLAAQCAVAPADRTTREPAEPGVRLRKFLGLEPDADA